VSLKTGDWEWSLWDKLVLKIGNCTLSDFLDYFEETYGLEVNMITYGPAMIFAFWTPQKKLRLRKKMNMTQLIHEIAKKQIPLNTTELHFDVTCVDMETDEDVDLPPIVLEF